MKYFKYLLTQFSCQRATGNYIDFCFKYIIRGGVDVKQILVNMDKCMGCKNCELACSTVHSNSKELVTSVLKNEKPVRRVTVETNGLISLPIQCRQCSEPKCVTACMTGATYTDQESGLVLVNEEKCVGCWMCVMVCPFGTVVNDKRLKVATKCDQCYSEGHQPKCVDACPNKAIKYEEITDFDKNVKREFLTKIFSAKEG